MEYIDANAARALYPKVKGEIYGAVLFSGFAVLDMGVGAMGVMVAGKMVACCPTFDHALEAGRKEADKQLRVERARVAADTGPASHENEDELSAAIIALTEV